MVKKKNDVHIKVHTNAVRGTQTYTEGVLCRGKKENLFCVLVSL